MHSKTKGLYNADAHAGARPPKFEIAFSVDLAVCPTIAHIPLCPFCHPNSIDESICDPNTLSLQVHTSVTIAQWICLGLRRLIFPWRRALGPHWHGHEPIQQLLDPNGFDLISTNHLGRMLR